MSPPGAVWTVGAGAAELAIVVAVVAVGAENLGSHSAIGRDAVKVHHVGPQTGLGIRTAAGVHDRVAGGSGDGKLRNEVQRIARRYRTHREVSIDRLHLFAGTRAVAAKAVFILIDGGRQYAGPIAGVNAGNVLLRDADERRRREDPDRLRAVSGVAVHAGGVTVVVEQRALGSVVRIGCAGEADGQP